MIASRIVLIPVLAAVGYEMLKFGARYRRNPLVKVIMFPGILVQMITTKRPTDDMIEVAITSMEEALARRREHRSRPAPTDFDRAPMEPRDAAGTPEPAADRSAADHARTSRRRLP